MRERIEHANWPAPVPSAQPPNREHASRLQISRLTQQRGKLPPAQKRKSVTKQRNVIQCSHTHCQICLSLSLSLPLSLSSSFLISIEKLVESPSAQNASISPKAFLPASPLMATSTAVACAAVVLAPGFCKPALESAPVGSPPEPTAPGPTPKTPTKPASVATALAAGLATVATAAEPSAESEEEKAKKLLYCSLCKVAVNSLSQLEAHNTGVPTSVCLYAMLPISPPKDLTAVCCPFHSLAPISLSVHKYVQFCRFHLHIKCLFCIH